MLDAKYTNQDLNKKHNTNRNNNNNNNDIDEEFKRSELTESEYTNTNLSELTGNGKLNKFKDDTKDNSCDTHSTRKQLTDEQIAMLNNEENFQNYKPFTQQSALINQSVENALQANGEANVRQSQVKSHIGSQVQAQAQAQHPIDCINDEDVETTEHGYHSRNKSHFFNFFNVW